MTSADWLDVGFWSLAALWAGYTLSTLFAIGKLPFLPQADPRITDDQDGTDGDRRRPRVSIVLAARNEQERIGDTVTRLLGQRGIDLQLIVVDDRSDDRTPEILGEIARRDERLQLLRIDELPAGWLGKPHALHLGAAKAAGDWLLFTDADAWMVPDAVARAVACGDQQGVDHVCLLPRESAPGVGGNALMVAMRLTVARLFAGVNRDRWWTVAGVGAFNLVTREAYRDAGGHEALRFEVIDDMKLGLILRNRGYRSRIYEAGPDIDVHWAPSVIGLLRAIEKNLFAVFGFRLWLALLALTIQTIVWGGTFAGPIVGSTAGHAAGVAFLATTIPSCVLARRIGVSMGYGLLAPWMGPVLMVALARSAGQAMRRGGIVWRGTLYPLAELRAGRLPMFPRRVTLKPRRVAN